MPRETASAAAAALLQSLTAEDRAAAFEVLAREQRLVEEQWRSVRQTVPQDFSIGSIPHARDLPHARQAGSRSTRDNAAGYASGPWPVSRSAFRPVEQRGGEPLVASEFATGAYGYNTSPEPRYSYQPSGCASHDDDIAGRKRKSDQRDYSSPPRRPKAAPKDSPPDSPTSGAESHGTSGSGLQARRVVHPRPTASYPSWVGIRPTATVGSRAHRPSWSGLSEGAAMAPPSYQFHAGPSGPPAPSATRTQSHGSGVPTRDPTRDPTGHGGNYRGVSKAADGTRFVAYVMWHGTTNMVGMFDSEMEAAAAHDSALISMLGEYALPHLNFPQGVAVESAHGPRDLREPVSETGFGDAATFNGMLSTHMESGGGSQMMTQSGMTSNANSRQKMKLPRAPASAATETYQKSSQYRGVSWNKKDKKWQSMIFSKGKAIWLGYFKKQEDAARAYDAAAIRERGHKAKLNFADSRDAESSGPGPSATNEATPAP